MSFCLNFHNSAPHSGTRDFRIKAAEPVKLKTGGCWGSNSLRWVPKWVNCKEMSASFFPACFPWFAFSFYIGKEVYLWHSLLVSQEHSAPVCASSGKAFKSRLPCGNERGTKGDTQKGTVRSLWAATLSLGGTFWSLPSMFFTGTTNEITCLKTENKEVKRPSEQADPKSQSLFLVTLCSQDCMGQIFFLRPYSGGRVLTENAV